MAPTKTQKSADLAETSIPGRVEIVGGFDQSLPLAKIEVFGKKAVLYRIEAPDQALTIDGQPDPHQAGNIEQAEFYDKMTNARMFVDPDGTRTYMGTSELLAQGVKTADAEVSWVWYPL